MGKNKKTATSQNLMVDANGYLVNNNHNEFDPNNSFGNNYSNNYTQTTLDLDDINTNMAEDAHEALDVDSIRDIRNLAPRVDVTTNPEIFSNFLPTPDMYNQYPQYNQFQQPENFLSTDYNEIIKYDYQNNMYYDYNHSSVIQEEDEEDDDGFFDETEYNKRKFKIIILISVGLFYIFFLIVGIFNTNYLDGYAQIINFEIKEERVVFKDVYEKVIEIGTNEQFAGKSELESLAMTTKYTEKKIIYNNLISDYQIAIQKYQTKYNEESNLVNKGMYYDYITLLKMQEQLLTKVVSYYSYLNGDISVQSSTDLDYLESQILLEQATFADKYNTIIKSFELTKKKLKLA